MATRPQDRNSTQVFEPFPGGATLAQLEEFIRVARERGAPDDAYPRAKTDEDGEIIGLVCLVKRHPGLQRLALGDVGGQGS